MRIVVTGGTGNVGKRLVQELAESGNDVGVMTRSPTGKPPLPKGAAYIEADLTDRDSVVRAMTGATAVYLLTPLHPEEAQLGRDAVWAAVDARVDRVVFQSVHKAEEADHIPHFRSKVEIAEELARTGLEWTILAPSTFYQNALAYRAMLTGPGIYPQPIGPVGVSHVDCNDIAHIAMRCLLGSGHAGKTYAVVGPEPHTGEEISAIWAEALGRPVRYIGDDLKAWAEQMSEAMPEWLVDDLVIMFEYFVEHGLVATAQEVETCRQFLRRQPRSYESWVAEVAATWV